MRVHDLQEGPQGTCSILGTTGSPHTPWGHGGGGGSSSGWLLGPKAHQMPSSELHRGEGLPSPLTEEETEARGQ